MKEKEWPFECPNCGEGFGWGGGASILSVVEVAPFDSPCPHRCGAMLHGHVSRECVIEFATPAFTMEEYDE